MATDEDLERILSHKETHEEFITRFSGAEIGTVFSIPLDFIKPSQKDDGIRTVGSEEAPIDVFLESAKTGKKIVIDTGNHRYYLKKNRGEQTINGKKVPNPYENW